MPSSTPDGHGGARPGTALIPLVLVAGVGAVMCLCWHFHRRRNRSRVWISDPEASMIMMPLGIYGHAVHGPVVAAARRRHQVVEAAPAITIEQLDKMAPARPFETWKTVTQDGLMSPSRRYSTFLTCAICLDPLQDKDFIRDLPCHHCFHDICIAGWYTRSHSSCPVCKHQLRAPVIEMPPPPPPALMRQPQF